MDIAFVDWLLQRHVMAVKWFLWGYSQQNRNEYSTLIPREILKLIVGKIRIIHKKYINIIAVEAIKARNDQIYKIRVPAIKYDIPGIIQETNNTYDANRKLRHRIVDYFETRNVLVGTNEEQKNEALLILSLLHGDKFGVLIAFRNGISDECNLSPEGIRTWENRFKLDDYYVFIIELRRGWVIHVMYNHQTNRVLYTLDKYYNEMHNKEVVIDFKLFARGLGLFIEDYKYPKNHNDGTLKEFKDFAYEVKLQYDSCIN